MKCNVGGAERVARILIGLALITFAYLSLAGTGAVVAYVVGAILLVTGLVRFCPITTMLGINTCKESRTGAV